MDEREQANYMYHELEWTPTHLAALFDVSRVTMHRWINPEYRKRANRSGANRNKKNRYSTDPRLKAMAMSEQAKHKDIPKVWFEERLMAGVCEVTGIPFVLGDPLNPWSPEVDRKEPGSPYTPENCQMVVRMYNLAKSNYEHEDVLRLSNALSKHSA